MLAQAEFVFGAVAAAAGAYGIWLAWRKRQEEGRNLRVTATALIQSQPATAYSAATSFQFIRVELFNTSRTEIGVHGSAVLQPQGCQLRFFTTPEPLLAAPRFPFTLRGLHSIPWDIVVAAVPTGPVANANARAVQTHVAITFGDETTLTSNPVAIPLMLPPAQQPQASVTPTLSNAARMAQGASQRRALQRPYSRWAGRRAPRQ